MKRPRCERCGTFDIPLLRADAKWDHKDHTYCPACWRISWPIQQSQADEDYELHDAYFRASAQALPADVAKAIGGPPLKWMPTHRTTAFQGWTIRCAFEGCGRTALYKSVTCVDHAMSATA